MSTLDLSTLEFDGDLGGALVTNAVVLAEVLLEDGTTSWRLRSTTSLDGFLLLGVLTSLVDSIRQDRRSSWEDS